MFTIRCSQTYLRYITTIVTRPEPGTMRVCYLRSFDYLRWTTCCYRYRLFCLQRLPFDLFILTIYSDLCSVVLHRYVSIPPPTVFLPGLFCSTISFHFYTIHSLPIRLHLRCCSDYHFYRLLLTALFRYDTLFCSYHTTFYAFDSIISTATCSILFHHFGDLFLSFVPDSFAT